jgi:hypothetical protein
MSLIWMYPDLQHVYPKKGVTGTSPSRRATAICVLLLAAGLFTDSKSLIDDGVSLDLVMVEARRLFRCPSRGRWSLATVTGFGECRKP